MPTRGENHPDDTTARAPTASLSDDLLTPTESNLHDLADNGNLDATAAPDPNLAAEADDDYVDFSERKHSRFTTGLIVALIFTVGVLCGVLLTRTLSPTPQPQIVYVLNDAHSAPPPPTQSPSASASAR